MVRTRRAAFGTLVASKDPERKNTAWEPHVEQMISAGTPAICRPRLEEFSKVLAVSKRAAGRPERCTQNQTQLKTQSVGGSRSRRGHKNRNTVLLKEPRGLLVQLGCCASPPDPPVEAAAAPEAAEEKSAPSPRQRDPSHPVTEPRQNSERPRQFYKYPGSAHLLRAAGNNE